MQADGKNDQYPFVDESSMNQQGECVDILANACSLSKIIQGKEYTVT